MNGFILEQGNAWERRVLLGYDVVTGKQRYAHRIVHGGKREAQRMLAQMISEADKGLVARTNASVGDLLEAWFEMAAPGFSPKTTLNVAPRSTPRLKPGIAQPTHHSTGLNPSKRISGDRWFRACVEQPGLPTNT